METVIYDASVFWAFRAGWISLLFALALIAFGVFFALPRGARARLLRRKVESVRPEPVFLRIWLGLAAVVVALVIGMMTNAQVRDFLDGPRTITFVPAEMMVRTTAETGSRPLRYHVVVPAKSMRLEFELPEEVYGHLRPDGCYTFTFYSAHPKTIKSVTRIDELPADEAWLSRPGSADGEWKR